MRERAEELGGRFQIESSAKTGTRITAVFPIPHLTKHSLKSKLNSDILRAMSTLSRQKLTFVLITAVLLFGLMILAGSLSQIELSPGETFNWSSLLKGSAFNPESATTELGDEASQLPGSLVILFWLGLIAAFIYAFFSAKHRYRALTALAMVTVFLFLRRIVGHRITELQGTAVNAVPFEVEPASSAPLPQPPAYITDPPDWIIWVIGGVVILLLVAVAFYVLYLRRQKEPDPQQLFVQEAEQALQELDAGGDVKDVVLRCYAQMEGVMRQSQDIKRQQSMTPREFEDQLAMAGFGDEHIGRLVRLFEEVRYGGHSSGNRAEREARDCLSAIVASYG